MIIGNGDIASVLKDKKDWIFFASGVSNSSEIRPSEYKREKDLLLKQNKNKHLVYFSTLALFHPPTKYTNPLYPIHKKEMEELLKKEFKKYTIVRIGNITWGVNPNTLINSVRSKVLRKEKFEIPDIYRYIVTKSEFLHWISLIPDWSSEMNITGKRMKIKSIIKKYVYDKLYPKKT